MQQQQQQQTALYSVPISDISNTKQASSHFIIIQDASSAAQAQGDASFVGILFKTDEHASKFQSSLTETTQKMHKSAMASVFSEISKKSTTPTNTAGKKQQTTIAVPSLNIQALQHVEKEPEEKQQVVVPQLPIAAIPAPSTSFVSKQLFVDHVKHMIQVQDSQIALYTKEKQYWQQLLQQLE